MVRREHRRAVGGEQNCENWQSNTQRPDLTCFHLSGLAKACRTSVSAKSGSLSTGKCN